uniref:Phage head morphogenesis domain-containing protein n=1 Tax=viral metagenome TaxID=1070528 RepID=A0A6M3INX7_9ZZZZ
MRILDSSGRPFAQPDPARWQKPISTKQRSTFDFYTDGRDDFVPDMLVKEKGFVIYDVMLEEDGDVKNAYHLKKYSLISPGWEVKPAETEDDAQKEKAEELREFVDDVLRGMDHSFDSFLIKLGDAFRQGFKLAEKVLQPMEGRWAGKWGIRKLLVRNSRWYRFRTDEAGELLSDGIVELPNEAYDPDAYLECDPPMESRRLRSDRFVVYTHGATDDSGESLYGRSDFRAAFRYYYSNLQLQKIRDSGIERMLEGYRVARRKSGGTAADDTAVLNALEELGNIMAAVIPEGYEFEHFNASEGGAAIANLLDSAMESNGARIARSMLVGDLVQSKGQVGSFALGKMQFTTFLLVVQAIAREQAWCLNDQLVCPLIDLNFPNAEGLYPELYFNAANTEDAEVKAKILKLLIDGGVVDKREQWVREYVGIPEMVPELAAKIEKEREEAKAAFEGGGAGGTPAANGKRAQKDPQAPDPKEDPKPGERKELTETTGGHLAFHRQLLAVEQKIDYAEVAGNLSRIQAEAVADVDVALEKIFSSLKAQARKKKIVEEKKRLEAANLRADPTPLARAIFRSSARLYVQGKVDAIKEISKQLVLMGEDPITDERQYIDSRDLAAGLGIDLTEEQRRLSGAMKISDAELQAFRDRTMATAQIRAAESVAKIQAEFSAQLLAGLENGRSWAQVAKSVTDEVEARWVAAGGEFAAGTGPIIDTLENAAYNEARFKLYEQAATYVEALVYSAILDNGTTEFCRRHDGFIARRDDPIWASITPPNHFRCRSIIGAVLRGESYDLSAKPNIQPSRGFDRVGFEPAADLVRRN